LVTAGTSINCWTVAGTVDYIGRLWTASHGGFSIDMDGRATPGTMSQTFATTPGSIYTVAFDMAANPGVAPPRLLRVSAAGQSSVRSFDSTGRSTTNMGWRRETFTFRADSAATTLAFASLSTAPSDGGAALDNVCVSAGDVPCSNGSAERTIAFGQTVTGVLSASSGRSVDCPNCYADVYTLTVTTARQLTITATSTAFDTFLNLLTSSNQIIASDDDGGGGLNSRITGMIQPGTYKVEITSALERETGAYTLAVAP
jgi:choice-of-anchor C domain-containing protein